MDSTSLARERVRKGIGGEKRVLLWLDANSAPWPSLAS